MITRLLVALFALYLVAGAPKTGDLSLATVLGGSGSSEAGQTHFAKQAVEFCLANRETCSGIATSLVAAPTRTGAISDPARSPEPQASQALPQPSPELPLPPRRRSQSPRGA